MNLDSLLGDGRIIGVALGLLTLEALFLVLRYRRTPELLLPWLAGLVSGAGLLLALRSALIGADSRWIGLWLLLALAGHGLDLWGRLRFETR